MEKSQSWTIMSTSSKPSVRAKLRLKLLTFTAELLMNNPIREFHFIAMLLLEFMSIGFTPLNLLCSSVEPKIEDLT